MRRRLLTVLLLFAALAVTGFAYPLAVSVSTSRTQQLWVSRYVYAGWFADLAERSMATGDRGPLLHEMRRYRELYGEHILVVDSDGADFANTGLDARQRPVAESVIAVRSNRQPMRPPSRLRTWDPDTLLIGAPIGSGLHIDGAVVIEASTRRAKAEIADYWALIALGSWTALALFTGLAVTVSQWILRPLARLSTSFATLTETLPKPADRDGPGGPARTMYDGPPEVQELTRSFEAMAHAVTDAARGQRQLVADTAHAIRNPLAALAIRLQALERLIPEEGIASFRRTTSQVDRLAAILDGLLKLAVAETPAGFDSAQTDARWPDRCDVVRVVADRIEEWQLAFEDAGQTLTTESMPTAAEAAVPTDAIEQILDIALSNACRYAGTDTQTTVRVDDGTPWVRISVTDDGVGVQPDELDLLTTRFFRAASATPGGSGLGLPIAAALTQRYRGQFVIESAHPHGLHLELRLPVPEKG
ncbi:sensor histidine kinase [Nocardia sp. NPDC127579]|uniref:sensor histidine kinase n=1 Tax=Nocardia sp. NPDC127579 TaxID=3345402 RepID=UPI00363E9C05